jgi:arylsulfatase A-like enzyme/HEAT repeat protein
MTDGRPLGRRSRAPAAPREAAAPVTARARRGRPRLDRPAAVEGDAAGVARRLADAYLALVAALIGELALLVVLARRELVLPTEVGVAARTLLPIAAILAGPAALALGGVIELVRSAEGRRARAATAALAAASGAAVAWGVGGGRHVAPVRAPFAAGVGIAAAVVAWLLAPRIARWAARARTAGRVRPIVVASVALALGLAVVNVTVLPRLYPVFHASLLALTGLAAAGVTLAVRPAGPRLGRVVLALGLFALAAVLAPGAPARLAPADNLRRVAFERSPALGRAVEIATLLEPPPPLDDEVGLDPSADPAAPSIDLRGRDIVLVTIDAMRADHVGAYGHDRPTTPGIDALAADGVVFERAYTATPHTSYAIGSLMTGKYLRPLTLMGLGDGSETWADHLRRYGYRTAAFFPPAVFFIDPERLAGLERRDLGFEYVKKEFASGAQRVEQVDAWLAEQPADRPLFLWVHLFEPHEPYEDHADRSFGDRDVDRYDEEIAAADAATATIVAHVRARRPGAVAIVTADHGEEFGDHGGWYHGTTVYEEQVRVPLVISAPDALAARRIAAPVQLVDLLPTVLSALRVPRPARLRGTDLGPVLAGRSDGAPGFAFAETDTMGLVAEGDLRLVCVRRAGACSLFDLHQDPRQRRDVGPRRPDQLARLRERLRGIDASHGRYEQRGLRDDGKGWPEALRRAIAGDGDAAVDAAALLDDADVTIRRKAAEALFELHRPETASSLRLAVARDDDDEVRTWAGLALARMGQGSGRALELVRDGDPKMRRLAALALAEAGDDEGEDELVAWLRAAYPTTKERRAPEPLAHGRARQIVAALGNIRAEAAVPVLLDALGDVRLRPHVAAALAAIDEPAARLPLAEALATERHRDARVAIVDALLRLGATYELRDPLVSLLGMPDPLPGGVAAATRADLLPHVGGPRDSELRRLRKFATSGVAVDLVVPAAPEGVTPAGVRAVCRARTTDGRAGQIRLGRRLRPPTRIERKAPVPASAPELDPDRAVMLEVPGGDGPSEIAASLPPALGIRPEDPVALVVYATQNVAVDACVLVPLRPELPPPPPEPWTPAPGR